MTMDPTPLRIGTTGFLPGESGVVDLPVGSLTGYQTVTMHVHVRRGRQPGPVLLLTAGLHGDELIGVEILRRLLQMRNLRSLKGSLVIVPIVCMPAFLARSRYLPDRRDLNRLFPGSPEGSLGSRLAHTFVKEIVPHATHSIDFHGGAVGRPNLPQIRISPGDSVAVDLARAFAPPIVIETGLREGSLRAHLKAKGIPSLLFEGGEAFRIDAEAIRCGLRGILGVMRCLGMLPPQKSDGKAAAATLFARSTGWVRAPQGGLVIPETDLGKRVTPGARLGTIADPFGRHETVIHSEVEGLVIGISREAHADEGDALFHLAGLPVGSDEERNEGVPDEIVEHRDPVE
jgi:predicted deacylase